MPDLVTDSVQYFPPPNGEFFKRRIRVSQGFGQSRLFFRKQNKRILLGYSKAQIRVSFLRLEYYEDTRGTVHDIIKVF